MTMVELAKSSFFE